MEGRFEVDFGGPPRGAPQSITVGCRVNGALTDTPVKFKVELKVVGLKPFSSVLVGIGTFNLERSTLVSRTRPRHQ